MENRDARPSGSKDDLQQIKGIKKKLADTLQALGFTTLEDLAGHTNESLAEALRGKISSISLNSIQRDDWTGQARAILKQHHPPSGTQEQDPAEKVARITPSRKPSDPWREVAAFHVTFGYAQTPEGEKLQTTAYHYQADKDQDWNGLSTDQLLDWMFTQANLKNLAPAEMLPSSSPISEPVEEPAGDFPLVLELSDLWVSQISTASGGTKAPPWLRLEVNLHVMPTEPEALPPEKVPYAVEIYIVNLEDNRSQLAASYPGHLAAVENTYRLQHDFVAPDPGRYQLYMIARLLPPGEGTAHLQGPLLRVET